VSISNEPRIYDVAKGTRADYGGRVDLLAECEGEWEGIVLSGNYVLDWKSSKKPQSKAGYPEWKMQTCGYRDGTEQEVHFDYEVHGNAVIRLDKFDGVPSVYDYSDAYEKGRADFHALVRYYRQAHDKQYAKGVPSVTTILGVLAKPALIQWAANCSRDYGLEELKKFIEAYTMEDIAEEMSVPVDVVRKWFQDAPKNFRKVGKVATDIGTDAHRFVEMDLKGDEMLHKVNWGQVNPNTEKAFDAYLKFKRAVQLVPLEIEYRVTGVVD
jgi:hypothetical protein